MTDPIAEFLKWQAEAAAHPNIADPTAMALATATSDGHPSVRMVLLKQADADGFVFFTNEGSQKGRELVANPFAELCFYWMPLEKQVRIRGSVTPVSDAESDAYYHSRPRGSQAGAWASHQSQPLNARQELVDRYHHMLAKHEDQDIPRPAYWYGWRLLPESIEFWKAGEFRLHHRFRFTRDGNSWSHQLLNP